VKTVAEWFPEKQRALATGIFNAGTNVGAVLAPLTVPWITIHYGWRWAFLSTGVLGFGWVLLWLIFYRSPDESLTAGTLRLANPPQPKVNVAWAGLLAHRQLWAIVMDCRWSSSTWLPTLAAWVEVGYRER
jgi:ACS family hexuronate transporter-like MFS transporter